MAAVPSSRTLEDRLGVLAERVRRQKIIAGACGFTLGILAVFTAILLLDAACSLSAAARC